MVDSGGNESRAEGTDKDTQRTDQKDEARLTGRNAQITNDGGHQGCKNESAYERQEEKQR
jgi:hypothetical protein